MSNLKQLSDGNPGGTAIGQDASDLVALHGASPVAQAAAIASAGTSAAVSVAGSPVFGFNTATQAAEIITAVNSMLTALRNKGIIAS